MLVELSANAGRVPAYNHLLQRVCGVNKEGGGLRDMHAVVSSLRCKLSGDADGPGCPGSTCRRMRCHRPAIESGGCRITLSLGREGFLPGRNHAIRRCLGV